MGLRVHRFRNSKRDCCRRELAGHPLQVIVKERTTYISGKPHPTITTHWIGVHEIHIGPYIDEKTGKEYPAESRTLDLSTTEDCDGVTSLVMGTIVRVPDQEAERKKNRENLNRVIGQIFPGMKLAEESNVAEMKEKPPVAKIT